MQPIAQQVFITPPSAVSAPMVTPRRLKALHALPLSDTQADRRSLRTQMFNEDGLVVSAKIDLSTGEIKPHRYKDYFSKRPVIRVKAEPSNVEPPWVRIPEQERGTLEAIKATVKTAAPASRKKRINSLQIYLEDYLSFSDALSDLPLLDNIILGSSLLDMGGNSRPVSQGALFHLLKNLEVITPADVRNIRGCSVRHSEKLALCLRVIVAAFDAAVEGSYSQPNA